MWRDGGYKIEGGPSRRLKPNICGSGEGRIPKRKDKGIGRVEKREDQHHGTSEQGTKGHGE